MRFFLSDDLYLDPLDIRLLNPEIPLNQLQHGVPTVTPPAPTEQIECENRNLSSKGIQYIWNETKGLCETVAVPNTVPITKTDNNITSITGATGIQAKPLLIAAIIGIGLYIVIK